MDKKHAETVKILEKQQVQELSIIRLGEPVQLAAEKDAAKRSSDASAEALENPTPSSLATDLTHYKELFSKLRFSYIEQVTKEKFLRAIVGDPPQIIEHHENVELEAQLVAVKAELKAQKVEVASIVDQLEKKGRELSQRYESITLQKNQLQSLPSEINTLEETVATLRDQQASQNSNPSLSLPLPATLDLLASRQAELDQLNHQLKTLQHTVPRKTRELERLENELKPLEVQKLGTVAAAKEAIKRKEDGERGIGDDLELKGRWYKSVETGLKDILSTDG